MHIRHLPISETIFTHYDDKTGKETVFAAGSLTNNVKQKILTGELEIVKIPIDAEFAEWCLTHRGIETHRLDRLNPEHLLDPMIFLTQNDKSHLLVDGNHRYVRHWQLGILEGLAVIVPKRVWRNFIITGLPKGSEHELLNRFSGIL